MKVNLYIETINKLDDYHNLDLISTDLDYELKEVDDGEATEIRAIDILEYYPKTEVEKLIGYLLKKVSHKGRLVIGGYDAIDVMKGFVVGKIDMDETTFALYGERKEVPYHKKVCYTVHQIAEFLESKNMKILKKRVSHFRYVVEAERI
jgi:hypothetical protein